MANFDDTYDESRNFQEVLFQNKKDVKANELNEAQRMERIQRRRSFQQLYTTSTFILSGFKVEQNIDNVNKVIVRAGYVFVDGQLVQLTTDQVITGLTTPGAPRVDEVYLEVREVEKTSIDYPDIGDADIGETTTRLQLDFLLQVAEGASMPASSGELHSGGVKRVLLATLNRDANSSVLTAEIVDERNLQITFPGINAQGDVTVQGDLEHQGTNLGFHGATPSAQDTGWSATNVTLDKVFNADSLTMHELADVVGSLINQLKAKGLIGS